VLGAVAGGHVEVVVLVVALMVAGAQTSFDPLGVTSRVPNWSFRPIAGSAAARER
jgi:hypothetical protein